MGLTLQQALPARLPLALTHFLAATQAPTPRPIYADDSFTVNSPLMAVLTQSPTDQTKNYAVAATGVHLPPAHRLPAVALRISTPPGSALDAYYQELLGISVSVLASRTTPLAAFLDFSSAITRAHQSLSLLGPMVGHLQHDFLLLGIRALSTLSPLPLTLTWTPSHPEWKRSQST